MPFLVQKRKEPAFTQRDAERDLLSPILQNIQYFVPQRIQSLACVRGNGYGPAEPGAQLSTSHAARGLVGFIEDSDPGLMEGVQIVQGCVDGFDLGIHLGMGCVDDVKQKIGFGDFFQR